MKAKSLIYSYSHKDEILRDELEIHLSLLKRQGYIVSWHDRKILPSQEWAGVIDDNFKSADIILLLISADFIDSDYCYEIEMRTALKRHGAGEAHVIPVILRDVDWHQAPFSNLQALPRDGKPITLWSDRDEAWKNVAQGIRRVAAGDRAITSKEPTDAEELDRIVRTFMFTDIVKSTDIRSLCILSYGDHEGNLIYEEKVQKPHDEILDQLVKKFDGKVVSTHGDSYFINFRSERKAVECSAAIQREFISRKISIPVSGGNVPPYVQVRIGIHTGPAKEVLRAGQINYSDHTINIAARIQALAEREQVLISEDTWKDVGDVADVTVGVTREVALKGVAGLKIIHEIVWDGRLPVNPH
jgi:class 3 adenylate cyclase